MGDPRKARKTYSTPNHPWQKSRIDEEKILRREYGFRNKKELWKLSSKLKNYFDRSKEYVARETPQSIIEQEHMLNKLKGYGLISDDGIIADVLDITIKDMLERRLQTILFRKGFARSIKQARQFIVHGHVMIAGKKMTSPSYLVSLEEENKIVFCESSSLASEEHPERSLVAKEQETSEGSEE